MEIKYKIWAKQLGLYSQLTWVLWVISYVVSL